MHLKIKSFHLLKKAINQIIIEQEYTDTKIPSFQVIEFYLEYDFNKTNFKTYVIGLIYPKKCEKLIITNEKLEF